MDRLTVWRKRILFRHVARKPVMKDLFDDIGEPKSSHTMMRTTELALPQVAI